MTLREETVTRAGFAATRCHVEVAESHHHRTWRDIRAMLLEAPLDDAVRDLALRVFERLAVAEAAVHGSEPMDVHFHEVGALDAIADVVGVCAGVVALGADQVVVSPVAVGSGSVRGAHGTLPGPAAGGRPAAARRAVVRRSRGRAGDGALHADRRRAAHHHRHGLGAAAADDHAARSASARAAATRRATPTCCVSSSATRPPWPATAPTTCSSSRPTSTTSTRACGPR